MDDENYVLIRPEWINSIHARLHGDLSGLGVFMTLFALAARDGRDNFIATIDEVAAQLNINSDAARNEITKLSDQSLITVDDDRLDGTLIIQIVGYKDNVRTE